MDSDTQRIIRQTLGYFWNDVFLDEGFVEGYARSLAIDMSRLDDLAVQMPDYLSRQNVPMTLPHRVRLFLFDEAELDTVSLRFSADSGAVFGGGSRAYGEEDLPPSFRYPWDNDFSVNFLCAGITAPGTILTAGIDFVLEDGQILFYADPLGISDIDNKPTITEDGTKLQFYMWGFQVEEDIHATSDYFGTVAGICGPSNPSTHAAVNIAWDLRVEGATARNLNRVLALATDCDAVVEEEKVLEVYPEGQRICVATPSAVYTAPSTALSLVSAGDTVTPGDPLFDCYEISHSGQDITFNQFLGLTLGPGYIAGSSSGVLFENAFLPVTKEHRDSWVSIRAFGGGFQILSKAGDIIDFKDTEDEAKAVLDAIPTDIYTIPLGGHSVDVDRVLLSWNVDGDPTFMDQVKAAWGRVPTHLNPFVEVRKRYFLNNTWFITLRIAALNGALASQLLTVLQRTIPAGSSFFTVLEHREIAEAVPTAGIGEDVTVFYTVEATDYHSAGDDGAGEHITIARAV